MNNGVMEINHSLYDSALCRAQFPALQLEVGGKTAVYLDGPAGTQVAQRVLDAIMLCRR